MIIVLIITIHKCKSLHKATACAPVHVFNEVPETCGGSGPSEMLLQQQRKLQHILCRIHKEAHTELTKYLNARKKPLNLIIRGFI